MFSIYVFSVVFYTSNYILLVNDNITNVKNIYLYKLYISYKSLRANSEYSLMELQGNFFFNRSLYRTNSWR